MFEINLREGCIGNNFLKFSNLRQFLANFRQITSLLSDSLMMPNCFKVSE